MTAGNSNPNVPSGINPTIRTIWHIGYFAVAAGAAHVAAFLAAILLAIGTAMTFGKQFAIPPDVGALPITAVFVLIVSRVAVRKLEGADPRSLGFGFDRAWVRHLIFGALLGAGLMLSIWGALSVAGFANSKANVGNDRQMILQIVALAYCVGIALHEELLFRGLPFQLLARRSLPLAHAVCGLGFVAIHVPNEGGGHPLVWVNLFLAHLMFAACYLRTRSLWLPVAVHASWNYVAGFVVGLPFFGKTLSAALMKTELTQSVWSGFAFGADGGLIATAVLALTGLALWKLLPQRVPAHDLIAHERPPLPSHGAVAVPEDAPVMESPRSPRIRAIDALRGTALLGILPMNMHIFALFPSSVVYPYASEFTDRTNMIVWTALRFVIGNKDLSMFSMLFGAGLLLLFESRSRSGERPERVHLRRMAVLFAFGMVHAYFVFSGDILVTYALVGVLVYHLRNLSARVLIAIGSAAYLVPVGLLFAAHFLLPLLPAETVQGVSEQIRPTPEQIAEYCTAYGEGWWDQMRVRVPTALANQTVAVIGAMGWIAAGMMILGMGLQRLGVFAGERPTRDYVLMIAAAALIGYPLLATSFWWNFRMEWAVPGGYFLGWGVREIAYGVIIFGWIGAMVLLCRAGRLRLVTGALSAVGQLSMSGYLAQSVVMSLIFHGHGLGMIGTLDHLELVYVAALLGAVQIAASVLWLRWFRLGPAEWLWRSLVEMRWQRWR